MSLLLAGCSRPSKTPVGRVSDPPARTDERPAIVAFGDSLSAGFGVDPGRSFPDYLQQEIDRRGYRYRVVNADRKSVV